MTVRFLTLDSGILSDGLGPVISWLEPQNPKGFDTEKNMRKFTTIVNGKSPGDVALVVGPVVEQIPSKAYPGTTDDSYFHRDLAKVAFRSLGQGWATQGGGKMRCFAGASTRWKILFSDRSSEFGPFTAAFCQYGPDIAKVFRQQVTIRWESNFSPP